MSIRTDSAKNDVERRIAEAVKAEREACAKIADNYYTGKAPEMLRQLMEMANTCGHRIAAAIRARGEKSGQ